MPLWVSASVAAEPIDTAIENSPEFTVRSVAEIALLRRDIGGLRRRDAAGLDDPRRDQRDIIRAGAAGEQTARRDRMSIVAVLPVASRQKLIWFGLNGVVTP